MVDGQVNKFPYIIIEVANTHGGQIDYLKNLVSQFESYHNGYGIKFQAFHYDTLATEDFDYYDVYKKLVFGLEEWCEVIEEASRTKDVWLDVFDGFGIEVLKQNLGSVHGIKLQVSAVFNLELIDLLSELAISDKRLIVNVASLDIDEIARVLESIREKLRVSELLIEVGFQAFPTELSDSGLSKIQLFKKEFGTEIVFADHLDGKSDKSIWTPIFAYCKGANFIEKHVMLGEEFETEYDHFSSLTPRRFKFFVENLEAYSNALNAPLVNDREKEYFNKTLLRPILKTNKEHRSLIDIKNDFAYKRTNQDGLTIPQIEALTEEHNVFSQPLEEGKTLQNSSLKKAKIAVIIAARLKSSRLKQKALLKLGELTTLEMCLKNASKFSGVDEVILATSTLESDDQLAIQEYNPQVFVHRGSPEDVIDRYLGVIRQKDIDVFVRVTGDNPFIDNKIYQTLIESHFKTGADYTTAKKAALGTNLEIINVNALEKVNSYFPNAEYSEYMTWYFVNNPEHFKLNVIDLPESFVRDYRLTLDYPEDMEMFTEIHNQLHSKMPDYDLSDVFNLLDTSPEIAKINANCQVKYQTDPQLIKTLNEKTKIIK